MPRSESQKESQRKYREGKQIVVRVPRSLKDAVAEHTAKTGESENGFLVRAIEEAMAQKDPPSTEEKVSLAVTLPSKEKREEVNAFAKQHYGKTADFLRAAVTEAIHNDNSK